MSRVSHHFSPQAEAESCGENHRCIELGLRKPWENHGKMIEPLGDTLGKATRFGLRMIEILLVL